MLKEAGKQGGRAGNRGEHETLQLAQAGQRAGEAGTSE